MRRTLIPFSVPFMALLALVSCDSTQGTQPAGLAHSHAVPNAPSNVVMESELALDVKDATARFNSQVQAEKAGYVESSPCIASPAGGMGYHWVNGPLVDSIFDPLNPEALVYAPDKHGRQRLVAVEYIVLDKGQPAPEFDGYPFDEGGTPVPDPHWSLHAWLFKTNPSGVHAPFNPDVTCPEIEI